MKDYVLDANAIILYLEGAPQARKVEDLFRELETQESKLAIAAINWAECRHILARKHGAAQAGILMSKIANVLEIVVADRFHAERAGDLRCRFNASLADCFAASLALCRKATLVTADPEFDVLKRELKLLRIESKL
jgi:predicted nucleic acid-binding protein